MKVTSHDVSQSGVAGAGGAHDAHKSTGSGGTNKSSGGSDHVDFSSAIGSLSRAMSSDSSSRQSRIQVLAAQYQAGSYKSDSMAISRGVISEAFSS